MPPEWRRKISIGLRGNKNRNGIPHSEADREKIAVGVKLAYAEGRHLVCPNPQNLSGIHKRLKAGEPAPWRKVKDDRDAVEAYRLHGSYCAAGAALGVTGSAVRLAILRVKK